VLTAMILVPGLGPEVKHARIGDPDFEGVGR
jgi:hypothetical protein